MSLFEEAESNDRPDLSAASLPRKSGTELLPHHAIRGDTSADGGKDSVEMDSDDVKAQPPATEVLNPALEGRIQILKQEK